MNLKNKTTTVFNYSDYLRNYYNRMASGKERIPSDAELSLFLRQLGNLNPFKSPEAALAEEIESVDDVSIFKMIA